VMAPAVLGAVCLGAPRPLAAQTHDPDLKVAGGGAFPKAWHVHTDRDKPTSDVKIVPMGAGFHITLGPAIVLWRDADRASGRYNVGATFTQTKNPRNPEGYGLIIGGSHLGDVKNRYTYFLVRGDGTFLVKRRVVGDSTAKVTPDWVASDAVHKADSAGRATNELRIGVERGRVSFLVNGTEVYAGDSQRLDTQGLAGYRVNHNLDLRVSTLSIHKR
jgi:hypothetical protein